MKRVLNKILVGTLLACLAFHTSYVYANSMEIKKSDLIQDETNEMEEIPDVAMCLGDHSENFGVCPDDSYKYRIASGYEGGYGTITFEKRAENIKLICRVVDTGKEIFSETYSTENKNIPSEGIKTIKFEMKMNGTYQYEIEIKNEDTINISGNIKLRY